MSCFLDGMSCFLLQLIESNAISWSISAQSQGNSAHKAAQSMCRNVESCAFCRNKCRKNVGINVHSCAFLNGIFAECPINFSEFLQIYLIADINLN